MNIITRIQRYKYSYNCMYAFIITHISVCKSVISNFDHL